MTIDVRPVGAEDAPGWQDLYSAYRAFYGLAEDPESVARTWSWVRDGEHGLIGLVATLDERLVGLANLRRFARPSTASIGLYLDDLYVDPSARGAGAARALLRRASELAHDEGASIVRWITADDNATARSVYDTLARATPWVTYDMDPAAASPGR